MRTNILNRLAAGMIWAALGTAGIAAETSPLPDPVLGSVKDMVGRAPARLAAGA